MLLSTQYYSISAITISRSCCCYFFFFNDTATTEIYTLSLHDALPISKKEWKRSPCIRTWTGSRPTCARSEEHTSELQHSQISYAVFCLKKKKKKKAMA